MVERAWLLRRISEFGNGFGRSGDAFYQFRPKVRSLHHFASSLLIIGRLSAWMVQKSKVFLEQHTPDHLSLAYHGQNLIKGLNTPVGIVSKVTSANNANAKSVLVSARHDAEAEAADKTYCMA